MNPKMVMLIEDDRDDQEFFSFASETVSLVADMQIFPDGAAALSFLAKDDRLPDVIFLDLNMPKVDGFEFLRRKSKAPQLKDIPVIVLTTTGDEQTKEKSLGLGANYFITKPVSIEALAHEVRSGLRFVFDS